MAFIRKIKAALVRLDSSVYVGEGSYLFYDVDTACIRITDGTPGGRAACIEGSAGAVDWGGITGNILDQTDLITYIGVNAGDDDAIRDFIGKDAIGVEAPSYSSTNQITQGNDLEGAIGEIDVAIGIDLVGNTIITTGDPSNSAIQDLANYVEGNGQVITINNITTITTVDAVVGTIAKWIIRIKEAAIPSNVYATELIATHDGSAVDSAKYAILNLGSSITGLGVTVTLTTGDTLNVNVVSTDAVDVVIKRIMVV